MAGGDGLFIGGLIDHPLGSKAVEGGQTGDGEGAHQEADGGLGHPLAQAAQLVQIGAAGGIEDGAGAQEQQALEQGVVHGVEQAARQAQRRAQAGGRDHIADLGDGVEGQQTLEIMLRQRHGNAHEHGHRADDGQQGLHRGGIHGAEDDVKQTDHAVDAGLVHHTGEHHGDGGGSHGVGIGGRGVEGNQIGLHAEAGHQHAQRQRGGGGMGGGKDGGKLRHVQRVALGIEQGDAEQGEGGAHGADDQIFEAGFQSALLLAAEGGQGHAGEGHDLDHDEHIEDIAGEHKTQHRAGEHQIQGVVVAQMMVPLHVLQRIDAGEQEGGDHQQSEEQVQLVDLIADADGIAVDRLPVAHPVGDHLAVDHDGLDQSDDLRKGDGCGANGQDVPDGLVLGAEDLHKERAQKQAHDGHRGEMFITNHPRSLLISSALVV